MQSSIISDQKSCDILTLKYLYYDHSMKFRAYSLGESKYTGGVTIS